MVTIKTLLKPDYVRYEGVRPLNIYLLRLLYFGIMVLVGLDAWKTILHHTGPWDPLHAVAFCVWATYPTLFIFGLIHPLKWLPLVLFMIFYKILWLIVVAYPLWRAHALAGSPSDGLAHAFIGAPVMILFVPWRYVFENYIYKRKVKRT
jgi:hypothetical protein